MSEKLSALKLTPTRGIDEEPCTATFCRTCQKFLYVGYTGDLLKESDPNFLNRLRSRVAINRAQIHTKIYSEPHHVQVVQGTQMIYEKNEPIDDSSYSYLAFFNQVGDKSH